MNTAQQIIKALAIVLAILIIGGMIGGIAIAGMTLSYIFDDRDGSTSIVEDNISLLEGEIEAETTLSELRIYTRVSSLIIMTGDELQVKAPVGRVGIQQSRSSLEIREKKTYFWERWGERPGQIVVVVPSEVELDKFVLESGAGRVEIQGLTTKQALIDLGAGRTEISRLVATEVVEIDSGAGHLAVRESKLHNLDLDMGAGLVEIVAELSGINQLDAGVGKLELVLSGEETEYQFKVEKGLGSITLNDEKIGDGTIRGSGSTVIDIDGGVGAIQIRTN